MNAFAEVSPALFACAALAAILVGLSKGGLPSIGMLAVPILGLAVSPVTAAAVLLPIYVVSDLFGLYLYRHAYSGRNLRILVPASIAGVVIGWAGASMVSERGMTLLIGGIGLAFCADQWRKRHQAISPAPADVPRGIFWGALTGFTSFVSHSGAPPFQMYVLPQKLPKLEFAGTSTILFAIVNAAKIVPYYALGQLSPANLTLAPLLCPFALVAAFVGARLVRVMPERLFYVLVFVALFAVSLKLVVDGLLP